MGFLTLSIAAVAQRAVAGADNLISVREALADVTSLTFGSIPTAYDHLELIWNARSSIGGLNDRLSVFLNGDSTTGNYVRQSAEHAGNSLVETGTAGAEIIPVPGSLAPAGSYASGRAQIPFYRDSHLKLIDGVSSEFRANDDLRLSTDGLVWETNPAITSISIDGSIASGSKFWLYGVDSTRIQLQEPTSGTSVTFSSIPQTYRHLELWTKVRTSFNVANPVLSIALNGDTTVTNYHSQYARFRASLTFEEEGSDNNISFGVGVLGPANSFAKGRMAIEDYTDSNLKIVRNKSLALRSGNTLPNVKSSVVYETSTNAVTSLTLTSVDGGDFVTGTAFDLRGVM